jgi:predicted branched-subunit amino acid permease
MTPGFTSGAFMLGMRRSVPLLVGLSPFGLIVGVMAQGQGLSLAEVTLMSALCYAGSAQILVLGHWAMPAPVLTASLAAFIINLRLALMGPVLSPWLDRIHGWRLWSTLFMMADQNWALSVEHMRRGEGDAGFLFGSGFLIWVVWVATTMLGHWAGAIVRPPPGHPVFFAALAVFLALLTRMWRGRSDGLPWAVAASVSVLAAQILPGSWYIVIGALAGSLVGAARDRLSA